VPFPALMMFLRVGKQDHEDQGHYDTSGDEVLHHGCHSASLAHWVVATAAMIMITKAAAVNAARVVEPGRRGGKAVEEMVPA
jgi:hypothetical protein